MRPADSCTYSLTRLLRWLESLSVARCSSLWQRYVLRSLSSSLTNSSSFLRSPDTQCKRPVAKLRAPLIHTLRLVPGVRRGFCFPLRIQQKPTLGLVSSLVSSWKKVPASSRVIRRTSSSLARLCSICSSESLSGPTGRGLLQRKPSRWSARRTVSRLTKRAARSPNSWRAMSLQLQRSWRAQPAVVGGRILFDQMLDALVRSFSQQRLRASPLPVIEGHPPQQSDRGPRRRWCLRTEEGAGDLGGRATLRSEQDDVHPQSAAGFRFALHFGDEALAYLGGEGDILHVRPSLCWLDGCGVFTMPQRTAVCSIILCIYLDLPGGLGDPAILRLGATSPYRMFRAVSGLTLK